MKRHFGAAAAIACALATAAPAAALAHDGGGGDPLRPGNLLVSGSTYREADIQPGVTQLPPGCTAGNCATATSDGAYPYVFNNDLADGSFGVTSPIFLWQLTPSGDVIGQHRGADPRTGDELLVQVRAGPQPVHHRTRGDLHGLRGAGRASSTSPTPTPRARSTRPTRYPAPTSARRPGLTSGATSPSPRPTPTAATTAARPILNDEPGANVFYTAGNAGNGANPQPAGVVAGAGAQIFSASTRSPRPRRTPARRRRWGASASPNSATRPTRSARTTTSAG